MYISVIYERVKGVGPSSPVWKTGALTVELHPHARCRSHHEVIAAAINMVRRHLRLHFVNNFAKSLFAVWLY